MKADKSQRLLGLASLERSRRSQSANSTLISIMKTGSLTVPKLSEELSEEFVVEFSRSCHPNLLDRDAAQVTKLRDLGMTPADETKLLALRDYISKLANSTLRYVNRLSANIPLQNHI